MQNKSQLYAKSFANLYAVFDFARLVGYNSNKYPQPDLMSMWTREEITNKQAEQWLGVKTIR